MLYKAFKTLVGHPTGTGSSNSYWKTVDSTVEPWIHLSTIKLHTCGHCFHFCKDFSMEICDPTNSPFLCLPLPTTDLKSRTHPTRKINFLSGELIASLAMTLSSDRAKISKEYSDSACDAGYFYKEPQIKRVTQLFEVLSCMLLV